MRKSNSKFIYVAVLIAALAGGFGTYGIGNPTTQVLTQGGENMTGMSEMGGAVVRRERI